MPLDNTSETSSTTANPALKDVLFEGTSDISLSKLLGRPIKDICGQISEEFDEPCFQITKIILKDGTVVDVNGEHSIAFICSDESAPENLQTERLQALIEADKDNEDDES